jgi:hypothetical protein
MERRAAIGMLDDAADAEPEQDAALHPWDGMPRAVGIAHAERRRPTRAREQLPDDLLRIGRQGVGGEREQRFDPFFERVRCRCALE